MRSLCLLAISAVFGFAQDQAEHAPQSVEPEPHTQPAPPTATPSRQFKLPDFRFKPGELRALMQSSATRCAIPLLEMKVPQDLTIPKAMIPESAQNDRIAVTPAVPACPLR
jgi:hypothetical protein